MGLDITKKNRVICEECGNADGTTAFFAASTIVDTPALIPSAIPAMIFDPRLSQSYDRNADLTSAIMLGIFATS